jgi:hypothetical protein
MLAIWGDLLLGCDNMPHSQAAFLSVASARFSKSVFKNSVGRGSDEKAVA